MKQRLRMIYVIGLLLAISLPAYTPFVYPVDPADMDTSNTEPTSCVKTADELFFSSDYASAVEYYEEALKYIDTP